MLEIDGLATGYGKIEVISDLSLRVELEEVVAVLGPNGAGKSTLARCISGLIKANRGSIRLGDDDITTARSAVRVAKGIAHVPEGRHVFPTMSVRENLSMGAYRTKRNVPALLDEQLERFPRLRERLGQRAGSLSGGEQQMLAIARGMMLNPRLIILDEPSLGLAPIMVDVVVEAIQGLRGSKRTVILIEQNPLVALDTADRVLVMRRGELHDHGDVDELRRSGRWRDLLRLEEMK